MNTSSFADLCSPDAAWVASAAGCRTHVALTAHGDEGFCNLQQLCSRDDAVLFQPTIQRPARHARRLGNVVGRAESTWSGEDCAHSAGQGRPSARHGRPEMAYECRDQRCADDRFNCLPNRGWVVVNSSDQCLTSLARREPRNGAKSSGRVRDINDYRDVRMLST